jgi:hypothetical protein
MQNMDKEKHVKQYYYFIRDEEKHIPLLFQLFF